MKCPTCGAAVSAVDAVCTSCAAPVAVRGVRTAASVEERLRSVLVTTSTSFEPTHEILDWRDVVFGEAVLGGSSFLDLSSASRDFGGGRSAAFEKHLQHARDLALDAMREHCLDIGGNAVVAATIEYQTVHGTLFMISARGTGVQVRPRPGYQRDDTPPGTVWWDCRAER